MCLWSFANIRKQKEPIYYPHIYRIKLKKCKIKFDHKFRVLQNLIDSMIPYIADEAPASAATDDQFFRCRSGRPSADIGRCN